MDGQVCFLGNWEVWIRGPREAIFSSPALIIHYVDAHEYRPPDEFIAAVMDFGAMHNWNAEAEYVRRTN
jgi:hypothetical protein